MKNLESIGSILEAIEKGLPLNRRDFSKAAVLLGSGSWLVSAGSLALGGCDRKPDWKSVSFPKVLLHNFKLFDGLQNGLKRDRCIPIEGGRIQGVERKEGLARYRDYKTVDLNGWTVLPGLIDNHVHITSPFMMRGRGLSRMDQQIEHNLRNCIMSGVTTVRDVGGFPGKIDAFRSKVDRNEIPGPRLVGSLSMIAARKGEQPGWPVHVPYWKDLQKQRVGGNFAERPTTTGEIKEVAEEMAGRGAQWLKTLHHEHTLSFHPRPLPNHTDEGYRAILATGEKHGIKCALHAMFVSGFAKGVELGFHTLEHMPMDDVIPERLVERAIEKGIAVIPTMMVYHDFLVHRRILELLEGHGKEYLVPEALEQVTGIVREWIDLEKRTLNEEEQRQLTVDPRYCKEMFPNVLRNLRKLHGLGAEIGIGTDCGAFRELFGRYADELKNITSAGISNFDALRMATAVNAGIIDMQETIGTIEKGKHADMVAVEGNPLEDIGAMGRVAMVMKGGAFIKAKRLWINENQAERQGAGR
jgi:imidazolonepropionase-like amidohydrolase